MSIWLPMTGLGYSSFLLLVLIPLGLCLGSFATVLVYRIPKGIPWIYDKDSRNNKHATRSRCSHCGAVLGILDLFPILSWVVSKGACRHCGQKISTLYPFIEMIVLLLVVIMSLAWGTNILGLVAYLTIPFIVATIVISWQGHKSLNSLNLSFFALCVAYLLLGMFLKEHGEKAGWFFEHLASGLVLPLLYGGLVLLIQKIKAPNPLGGGRINNLVPIGIFIGVYAVPSFLLLSGLLGLVLIPIIRPKTEKGGFPLEMVFVISLYIHLFLTGIGFY